MGRYRGPYAQEKQPMPTPGHGACYCPYHLQEQRYVCVGYKPSHSNETVSQEDIESFLNEMNNCEVKSPVPVPWVMCVHLLVLPAAALLGLLVYLTILAPGKSTTAGIVVLVVVGLAIIVGCVWLMVFLYRKWYRFVERIRSETQAIIDRNLETTF